MILGFAGYAGSGKNEAARGLGWPTFAFADQLRAMLLRLNPILGETFKGDAIRLSALVDISGWEDVKRGWPEVRRLLQELGMAARELVAADVWLWPVQDELDEIIYGTDAWKSYPPDYSLAQACVTDVRFPNEAKLIQREFHGKLLWIERPGLEVSSHPTEHAITPDDCDDIIVNNGTIEDLHRQVSEWVRLRQDNA